MKDAWEVREGMYTKEDEIINGKKFRKKWKHT